MHPVYFEICNEIVKNAVAVDMKSHFIIVAIGVTK